MITLSFTHLRNLLLALLLSIVLFMPSNAAQNRGLPIEEIREFAKALELIQNNYVDDTEQTELIRDAIRGMLRDLDPYSVYLDKRQKETLKVRTQGKFGGLGIQVSYEDNSVKVISPIDNTPASRAGIQSLDRIITINGEPTANMDLEGAVDRMRGKPGSSITIEVLREGEEGLLKFKLVREVIKLTSVVMKPLKDGYVYSRISNFQANTGKDYVDMLRKQGKKEKIKGVILDLRNNPGGLLSSAVEISDIFIDEGMIVSTAGRISSSQFAAKANGKDILKGTPVLVMINSGSASASEIVAGALQDHDRALIAGKKSFGKGTVQSVVELSPSASLKLTTARYKTPSGKFIDKIGIVPDVELEQPRALDDEKEKAFAEKYKDKVKAADFSKDGQALLERDTQLWDSYELLVKLVKTGDVAQFKKGS